MVDCIVYGHRIVINNMAIDHSMVDSMVLNEHSVMNSMVVYDQENEKTPQYCDVWR